MLKCSSGCTRCIRFASKEKKGFDMSLGLLQMIIGVSPVLAIPGHMKIQFGLENYKQFRLSISIIFYYFYCLTYHRPIQ